MVAQTHQMHQTLAMSIQSINYILCKIPILIQRTNEIRIMRCRRVGIDTDPLDMNQQS